MRLWMITIFVWFVPNFALLVAEDLDVKPFSNISEITQQEKVQDWVKEYNLGAAFASQKDTQSAVTCFKRALILCPKNSVHIKEIEYAIVLAYYLEQQYFQAIQFFETHSLLYADTQFSAYHDLMIILHHSYEILKKTKKADIILKHISEFSEKDALGSQLTGAVLRRDFATVEKVSEQMGQSKWIMKLTRSLLSKQKSKSVARWMNVIVPGSGYFYLGQKKAALTAFALNALLIWGSVQLFLSHYYTLGALTAIFEIGWYAGGIVGVKEATLIYNETLFANYAEKIIFHDEIAPQNKIKYEF